MAKNIWGNPEDLKNRAALVGDTTKIILNNRFHKLAMNPFLDQVSGDDKWLALSKIQTLLDQQKNGRLWIEAPDFSAPLNGPVALLVTKETHQSMQEVLDIVQRPSQPPPEDQNYLSIQYFAPVQDSDAANPSLFTFGSKRESITCRFNGRKIFFRYPDFDIVFKLDGAYKKAIAKETAKHKDNAPFTSAHASYKKYIEEDCLRDDKILFKAITYVANTLCLLAQQPQWLLKKNISSPVKKDTKQKPHFAAVPQDITPIHTIWHAYDALAVPRLRGETRTSLYASINKPDLKDKVAGHVGCMDAFQSAAQIQLSTAFWKAAQELTKAMPPYELWSTFQKSKPPSAFWIEAPTQDLENILLTETLQPIQTGFYVQQENGASKVHLFRKLLKQETAQESLRFICLNESEGLKRPHIITKCNSFPPFYPSDATQKKSRHVLASLPIALYLLNQATQELVLHMSGSTLSEEFKEHLIFKRFFKDEIKNPNDKSKNKEVPIASSLYNTIQWDHWERAKDEVRHGPERPEDLAKRALDLEQVAHVIFNDATLRVKVSRVKESKDYMLGDKLVCRGSHIRHRLSKIVDPVESALLRQGYRLIAAGHHLTP
ncbi:MAG: hypothetical protein FWF24_02580 [Alphaproteobacteria bacterium]|nr:hypothetical protein [Alphaproteobacteria bacterium]